MKTFTIEYRFGLQNGEQKCFTLQLDSDNLECRHSSEAEPPAWTALDYHQCRNCPLRKEHYPHCPVALRLVDIVNAFDEIVSYDELELEVITHERTIHQRTTAQKAVSSLLGLVMATSGCPHTRYFRPMARFHLPLAGEEETVYRAASMYLLAQYFIQQQGREADVSLEGLKQIYKTVQTVNQGIVERLRAATETDSSINALIILDIYARTIPMVIEESLQDVRYLFKAYTGGA